jgi:hypothetical protein
VQKVWLLEGQAENIMVGWLVGWLVVVIVFVDGSLFLLLD